ncbi:MAG: DUF4339 domain-containing protein [Planctomycetaceae bacterium]
MSTQFYRQSDDGRETGPFSREELLAAAMLGELTEGDLVRSEGSSLWLSARRVKGLFPEDAAVGGEAELAKRIHAESEGIGVPSYPGTAAAAQAAYEAQLRALESGGTDADSGRRSKNRRAAWWQGDVGWEVWLGVAVILAAIVYTVWVPSEQLRFPQSQRGGNMAPAGYFFFGTGPWSTLEYGLLWFDAGLVVGALLFGRRLLGRSGG